MNKVFLALSFFIIYTISSQECDLKISGYVFDIHDNSVLKNATIKVLDTNLYAITDDKGYYKIENICPGKYEVIVSHLNCEDVKRKVRLDKPKTIIFSLEHHLESLNEVLIKGELYNTTKKSTINSRLYESDIDKFSSQTFGDALSSVSGVSSIQTGSSIVKPVIHGLHSSRVLIMTNGVRLEDQQWGVEHAPNIDINAVSNITVVKGSNALKYGGDAVGGVIITNERKAPLIDTLMGKFLINGVSNGRGGNVALNLIKARKNGLNFRAQGSLKRLGDFEAADYILTNTGVRENNFSFGFGLNKIDKGFDLSYSRFSTEIGILRASHTGNADNFFFATIADQPDIIEPFSYAINVPRQEVTHQVLKAMAFRKFTNFGKVSLQYDYQNNRRFEFDIRRGDDRNTASLDLELQTHSLLLDATYDQPENFELSFGLMGRHQNNFPNPETGVRRFIPDYDKYDAGLYLTSNADLSDNISMDVGLRYDFNRIDAQKFYRISRWEERGYDDEFSDIIVDTLASQYLTNPVFTFHNISASAGISYQINERNKILVNYGLSSRPPNPAELFSDGLHHSLARIELGELRFDKEVSNKLLTSFQHNSEKLNFNIDAYYNHINNYIYLAPFGTQETNRGFFPVWEYQQTDAAIYGFDSYINFAFNDFLSVENKSALTFGEDLSRNDFIIDIPPFNTTTTLSYNNADWYNLNLGVTSQLVLQQNTFPDFNIPIPSTSDSEIRIADVSTPPPAYHLMHLYLGNSFKINEKYNLKTSLFVDNIFNLSYRNYLNQMRFFADDLGRNIRLQIQFNF